MQEVNTIKNARSKYNSCLQEIKYNSNVINQILKFAREKMVAWLIAHIHSGFTFTCRIKNFNRLAFNKLACGGVLFVYKFHL